MTHVPVPPEDLRTWVGPFHDVGLFLRSGHETMALGQTMGGLQRNHVVLDVGCGSGRVALALMDYLSPDAEYLGLDVAAEPIRWCQEHIGAAFPNFHFEELDVRHPDYNPGGRYRADEVPFPRSSASVDFVLASSVLTHLLAHEAAHHVREFARVLRPGGVALISFFLMDEEASRAVEAGRTVFEFRHPAGPGLSLSAENPTDGIAFPPEYVFDMLSAAGLDVQEVRRGSWREAGSHEAQHDWIAARKPRAAATSANLRTGHDGTVRGLHGPTAHNNRLPLNGLRRSAAGRRQRLP